MSLKSLKASRYLTPARIFFLINLSIILLVFILGFKPGAFRPKITANNLAIYHNKYLTFIGRVCEEAEVNIKNRRLTVCAIYLVNADGKIKKVSGRVLVSTALYPSYDYGDFVRIKGRLQRPSKFNDFDYGAYLARYDIYSVLYYPQIKQLAARLNASQKAYRLLLNFKQSLRRIINSVLPEPEAGLANALLLGYRKSLAREDLKIFARVGLSHLIAISGSHITILSALIINFLLALGFRRRRALLLVLGFLILYPILTGLGASALRSAIMGGLATLAIYYGRANSLIKALAFAAAMMLIFQPQLLRNDIGFQLSFLAILGIIYIYPLGDNLINKLLNKTSLKVKTKNILKVILETINLTLTAQIVILPIVLINFKQFSLIAPLANVLVLWTFPFILGSLIIALILTALIPIAGVLWFALTYFLLKFLFSVASLLAKPTWSAINFYNFNWYLAGGYYLALILIVYFLSSKQKTTF